MKQLIIVITVCISLPLLGNDGYLRSNLNGTWKDRYHDDKIEIRDTRYGLEVRKKGLFRKTRTFEEIDYNRYADYDGNIIEVLSSNRLVWKNRKNRSYKTFYRNGYSNSRYGNTINNRNRNNRYNNGSRYNDGNRRGQNRYDRGRIGNGFNGRWSCSEGRRNIFIETQGNGFRARKVNSDRWYTYEQDPYESNVYRSNNGEKYIYRDNSLIWYGKNGCDTIRFGRY